MFYYFVVFIVLCLFSYILYLIHFCMKRKVFTPLRAAHLWIVFKSTMQIGFLFILAYITGAVQPWLVEEKLSNLEPVNGTLEIRWGGKSNDYYLRKADNTETEFKFNLANLNDNSSRDRYGGKEVIVWHKKRYVYQMEDEKGEVIFSIESANRAIDAHNQIQAMLYILLIYGWIILILRSSYDKKLKLNGTENEKGV